MIDKALTPKQELFCQAVASGLDQSAAYQKAYPAALKWTKEAVRVAGSKMMGLANVSVRVKALLAQAADVAVLDGAQIMREIGWIAFSDIGGIMREDGRIKMPNELDAVTRAAVKTFKIDEYGRVEYQFWDKNAALTNAAKIRGLYEIDNKQKVDGLADLISTLGGKVLGVTRDVPKDDND